MSDYPRFDLNWPETADGLPRWADLVRAEHREGVAVGGPHQRGEFRGREPAAVDVACFGLGGAGRVAGAAVFLGVGHGL